MAGGCHDAPGVLPMAMFSGLPPGTPTSAATVPSVSSKFQKMTGGGMFEGVAVDDAVLEGVADVVTGGVNDGVGLAPNESDGVADAEGVWVPVGVRQNTGATE